MLSANLAGVFYDVIVISFSAVSIPPGAFAYVGAEHSGARFGLFCYRLTAVFADTMFGCKHFGVKSVSVAVSFYGGSRKSDLLADFCVSFSLLTHMTDDFLLCSGHINLLTRGLLTTPPRN